MVYVCTRKQTMNLMEWASVFILVHITWISSDLSNGLHFGHIPHYTRRDKIEKNMWMYSKRSCVHMCYTLSEPVLRRWTVWRKQMRQSLNRSWLHSDCPWLHSDCPTIYSLANYKQTLLKLDRWLISLFASCGSLLGDFKGRVLHEEGI